MNTPKERLQEAVSAMRNLQGISAAEWAQSYGKCELCGEVKYLREVNAV
jgi:hypothetical protein